MSIPSRRSQVIAIAFQKSIREEDKSLIESFSHQEIERTLIEYSADQGDSHYDAMERRLRELKEIQAQEREEIRDSENRKSNRRQRMVDRLVGLASGILLLLIGQYLAC